MNRFISNTPRPVLIAIAVIMGVLILTIILVPLLGGARDDALVQNRRLLEDIATAKRSIVTAKDDAVYVNENVAAYEALMKSDRLIPHTRRAAIVRLEEVARAQGLTAFNYSIGKVSTSSAKAVGSQPSSDAYRVSVESIELKVGAPIDGNVYRFLIDIADSFPGAAVLESFTLKRADFVSAAALDAVSRGEARLVEGELIVSWRTAQAKDKDGEKKK